MNSFNACVLSSPNPFHDLIAPDLLASPADTVPMFDEVLAGWEKSVAALEQTPAQGRSVVLAAAAGVGKTHLLLRFRHAMRDRVAVARIYPWPAADAFHHNLLAHLIGDWARPWPDGEAGPLFGLAETVGDPRAADPLRRALGLLAETDARRVALRWLMGQAINDETLNAWSLPVIEDELSARRMALDLLRLMAAHRPVALAFDQLDSAPRGADGAPDVTPLLAFNAELRAQTDLSGRILMILSLLADNWRRMKETPALKPALDLLDKRKGWSFLLTGSTPDQCRAVAALRLAPIHAKAGEDDAPEDPLFPLSPAQMSDAAILGARPTTPIRDFLRYAGAAYQSFKSRILIDAEGDEAPPSPPPPENPLRRHWLEQRALAEQQTRTGTINEADALRGLAWAWAGLTATAVPNDQPVLASPYGAFGRTVPDGRLVVWWEDPGNYKFYQFIKKLHAHAAQPILMLRSGNPPPKGLKGRELFDALFTGPTHQLAHRLVRPTPALKTMAIAMRRLDVMQAAGDLDGGVTRAGLLAALVELDAYQPLQELLEQLFGPAEPPDTRMGTSEIDPTPEKLLEQAQDLIDDYVSRELLVGWPHVRTRVLSLLPDATPALVVKAVEALVRAKGARWVNPNAALEQRLLSIPLAAAA